MFFAEGGTLGAGELGYDRFIDIIQFDVQMGEGVDVADGVFDLGEGFCAIVARWKHARFLDGCDGKFFSVPLVLDDERRVAVTVVGEGGNEEAIFDGECVITITEQAVRYFNNNHASPYLLK